MSEDFTSAKNILKLAIDLQNLCESTDNKEINKNILSIKFKILLLIQEFGRVSPSTLVGAPINALIALCSISA